LVVAVLRATGGDEEGGLLKSPALLFESVQLVVLMVDLELGLLPPAVLVENGAGPVLPSQQSAAVP